MIIKFPHVEEEKDEVTVSFVYVDVGGVLNEGDSVIELVSAKSTFDMPSPASGKVINVFVGEGDKVKEGSDICEIE